MKEIRPKEDKAVSPIIATILLIAITVVLAATLVTILGGFTHGVSNTVETAGVTSHITSKDIFINVSSSSSAISASSITVTITGASFKGTGDNLAAVANVGSTSSNATFTGGSDYQVPITLSNSQTPAGVSFELIYKGNVIYNSAA
ncbi:archaellin/type IV pilin N-terminal domain-containing protein [Cuniculiplasma divulgatum]|jgi:flagellin-like protein|uniref:Flagellin-like protein n=1 Tax=Cuniculiplasma divulgatum TaxID=1673428 RepID=A0A1R4A7X0_9ARCH|nr:archaellin/type IV pilin N-terminal domain-containing protein [Cuniculiplasma divulgatum]MCI2412831.1 type IV pilin [Cuniculiplasma sp.]SJK85058.1 flagellin-like protein [Cuniculiplasma divulgatum]